MEVHRQKGNIQILDSGLSLSGSRHSQLKKDNIQILDSGPSPDGSGHPQLYISAYAAYGYLLFLS